MPDDASRSPPRPPRRSPIKPPERCPYCASPKITTKGRRTKKLETIPLYRCRACDRRFTPGQITRVLMGDYDEEVRREVPKTLNAPKAYAA